MKGNIVPQPSPRSDRSSQSPAFATSALAWVRRRPRYFPLLTDLAAWPAGLTTGALLKLAFDVPNTGFELAMASLAAMAIQAGLGTKFGIYRRRWRFTSYEEVSAVATTWVVATVVVVAGNRTLRSVGPATSDLPSSAVLMGCILALMAIGGSRLAWRWHWERHRRPDTERARRTIVFGAGEGGIQMVKAMLADPDSDYVPVAFLDDNRELANREVAGVRVEGTRAQLEAVTVKYDAEMLLIAVTRADSVLIQELTTLAVEQGLDVRVLPATSELMGRITIADVRPPTVDDLLGRDPVEIDMESVSSYLKDRRVLITGAGGSIGSELSRQVAKFEPAELFLVDRDETALHSLQLSMDGRGLLDSESLVVADIRDRERMFEVFEFCRPEVVFHAAALKHLTLLENHPVEGVKTNMLGTRNVLDAAVEAKVDRFVNVSTDKAADPTSALGATKLAAERLTAQVADRADGVYVSVRFGNVLGSRGSVLPTFLKQIEQGNPLTVTDPDATRFFMTIPEASRLVMQAGAIGEPGEVMILDMGQPVRIDDLAKRLISLLRPSTQIEYTGLRPGEKLHEILVSVDEVGVARVHPRIIHAKPDLADPMEALGVLGSRVQADASRLSTVPAIA